MTEQSKRVRERIPFKTKMTLEFEGKSFTYLSTNDVSMNGAFVSTPKPLPLGAIDKFSLILSVGARHEKITGRYEVVRSIPADDDISQTDKGPGMGLTFTEFDSGSDITLFNVMRQNQSPE